MISAQLAVRAFALAALLATPVSVGAAAAFDATSEGGALRLKLALPADQRDLPVQFLIDTDRNPKTGWTFNDLGCDMMVEGERLYRFTADERATWGWTETGVVTRKVAADSVSVVVPEKALPHDEVSVVARVLSADYAKQIALEPNNGAVRVRIERAQAGSERKGDCDEPTRDFISIAAKQIDSHLEVTLTAAKPNDFATTLVFVDTDCSDDTGFNPPAEPGHGFELLVQGNAVSKFSGKTRDAWTWEPVGEVERSIDGATLKVKIPVQLLGSARVSIRAINMSADWQRPIDAAPDGAAVPIEIDTKKVGPAPRAVEMAPPRANRDLPVRQRVRAAKNFYCYYGSGRVEALSHYDVVILHSPQMDRKDIARLKAQGVVTIGYITVGEDDQLRVGDGRGPGGKASWYIDRDGDRAPDKNNVWNSYFVNANDPAWRADRLAEVNRLVREDGYDGIFLDTIDTIQRYKETIPGMVQMVRQFREAHPDMPIILNQGLEIVDQLGPLADGVMLESFTTSFDFNTKKYIRNVPSSLDWHNVRVQRYLSPFIEKNPTFRTLILDYAPATDTEAIQLAADRATSFGFLWAVAPIYLDQVYQYEITPRPDVRWTQKQSNPEMLRITLDEARNGFPAGTVVTPSSCFGEYTVEPIVAPLDGRAAMHWSKQAWASGESGEAQWLELTFPAELRAKGLKIAFAVDAGVPHVSRRFDVQVRRGGEWSTVKTVVDLKDVTSTVALPDAPIEGVRIHQPERGGSEIRPDLLWIAQLELQR